MSTTAAERFAITPGGHERRMSTTPERTPEPHDDDQPAVPPDQQPDEGAGPPAEGGKLDRPPEVTKPQTPRTP